jgi:glycerol-3-phosphate cytidylyltransferase-like family protein
MNFREGEQNFRTSAEFDRRESRFTNPYDKIVTPPIAQARIGHWQMQDQRVVMVDAVLDLPHAAHAEYLLACANLGDRLALRVNSDAFVASRKDPRGPIVSWEERAKHAAHYPYVDLVTSKNEGGWTWLREYNSDIIVKSTTSGPQVLDEIEQVRSQLDGLRTKVVVMDENGTIVPIDQAYKRGVEYDLTKMNASRQSGSMIKAEIVRRAREDNHLGEQK